MKKLNVKNNKKGFTLVELLAVIVVLAIIILIAMPAVLSSMEKARKNSFAVEANEIIRAAQTAYADAVMANTPVKNKICITYGYLTNGFLEKNDDNYNGSVLITITPSSGKADYKIWLSNNNYAVSGAVPDVTSSNITAKAAAASTNCDSEPDVTLLSK